MVLILRASSRDLPTSATVPTCYGFLWGWGTKLGTVFAARNGLIVPGRIADIPTIALSRAQGRFWRTIPG